MPYSSPLHSCFFVVPHTSRTFSSWHHITQPWQHTQLDASTAGLQYPQSPLGQPRPCLLPWLRSTLTQLNQGRGLGTLQGIFYFKFRLTLSLAARATRKQSHDHGKINEHDAITQYGSSQNGQSWEQYMPPFSVLQEFIPKINGPVYDHYHLNMKQALAQQLPRFGQWFSAWSSVWYKNCTSAS